MRKLLLSAILSLTAYCASGQFSNVSISINGLTCSQCCMSVEMQLKKLPFISKVHMDLKATTAQISLKSQQNVDFYKLAKAVDNAGFSVNNITARLELKSMQAINNQCYKFGSNSFWLLTPPKSDAIQVQFIGKPFGTPSTNQEYSICSGKTPYIVMPL